ncbi:TlpA family protein disulfide reductase [Paenibacillus monticola]|uniref:Redoxin domain-containing protein n=1 Tax=Paenibacillus monticola TaxID=2666075 RepID=A0A7X2H3G0_9BACL|nr:TlpA disulfide reductase family protein [Paenibacillus monticola]MRN52781.1 redoxin domain-containing protein [Paenibacillus monticola]
MNAVKKRNLTVMALVIFLLILTVWHNREPEAAAVFQQQTGLSTRIGPQAGLLAPSFSLKGSEDSVYSVGGTRDKAVMVNFWASWCDPCQQEAPELNAIAEQYKEVLDIYGINVTSYDYKPNAERFIKKYNITFPTMFDLKGDVFAKYNGAVFPTNVLIDKNGVISEIILGTLSREELEKKIIKLTQP